MIDVSLIVPVYRAERYLQKTLAALDAYLSQRPAATELILVVEASPDRSAEICRRFADKSHGYGVLVLLNEANLGKGATVQRGVLAAHGRYRIFTDCDLPYGVGDMDRVIAELEAGAEVVIASRVHPQSQYAIHASDLRYLYTRHLASRLFNRMVRATTSIPCRDTQAGLKGFQTDTAQYLFKQLHLKGFSFDVELLFLASRAGLQITEIPIHYQYQEEPSTVDFLSDAVRMIRDIVRVRLYAWRYEYHIPDRQGALRQLVIHADDFGLSDGITDGILESIQKGSVTATSIMVNLPASDRALKLAHENSLDAGWHINLTLGKPLSPPEEVPSLVQPDGTFYPLKKFLVRALLRRIKYHEVEQELRLQWRRLVAAGLYPSHVDGHQHVHLLPVVRNVVRELIREQKVPFVRVSNEKGGWGDPGFLVRLFLKGLKGARQSFWENGNTRTLPFYGMSLYHASDRGAAWSRLCNRIRGPVAEVMVHPGILRAGEDIHGDDFPGDRKSELDFLTDPQWQNLLKERGFTLTSFRELAL